MQSLCLQHARTFGRLFGDGIEIPQRNHDNTNGYQENAGDDHREHVQKYSSLVRGAGSATGLQICDKMRQKRGTCAGTDTHHLERAQQPQHAGFVFAAEPGRRPHRLSAGSGLHTKHRRERISKPAASHFGQRRNRETHTPGRGRLQCRAGTRTALREQS